MSPIQQRFQLLGLPESDCALLSQEQLNEIISTARSLVDGNTVLVAERYSVAALSPDAVNARLISFGVQEQKVLVCWPTFREGFRMSWELFTSRFDDLWYPGSDDIIVTSPKMSWALEITHEETIRFLRL
jgi:hypothetical protein